ncbi:LOW QUALITY PROTEIN: lysoplasmalogenase TMEM86B [Macrotis lagotis]|uniref:LOW QUALITY PROTEIN: lysoplasmalogenase TMEM86B n=1 Tax=Macrotis lagotis TaxID=92651 RepID=UPI003D69E003
MGTIFRLKCNQTPPIQPPSPPMPRSHNSRGVWSNMEARGSESGRKHTPDPLLLVLRLVPFLGTCALYFYLWMPLDKPSWISALVKCLPILCLALFVRTTALARSYGRFIWAGLLCSALGDVFLIWPDQFLFGMAAFTLAHLFYLGALGWLSIRPTLMGTVAAFFGLYFWFLQSHLPSNLRLPVLVYSIILGLMLWRGLTRGKWAAYGGLFFSISDAVLAWDTFVQPLFPGRLIIMTTYYTAQALLALSTVEDQAPKTD